MIHLYSVYCERQVPVYDRVVIYIGYNVELMSLDDTTPSEWVDTEWHLFGEFPIFEVSIPSKEEFQWDCISILIEDSHGYLESIPMQITTLE